MIYLLHLITTSGGFKVDEVPTMEGLSWSLSCVGVVTRTIHGKPDDDPNIIRADVPAVNMNDPASVQALADFYADVTDATGHFDTEADEYSVAAPGLSMKFLFDNAGNLVQFPYSNNRVEIQRATAGSLPRYIVKFIITNTEGVVYEFGSAGAIEKVTDHNINLRGGVKTRLGMSTAFYLTKITLPDGKNIQFDYLGFFNWGYSGAAESITRGGVSPPPFATCLDGTNVVYGPGAYPDPNSHVTTLSYIRYNQISLSSIISSNGQHINFNYGATPPNPGTTITADCLQSVEISAGDFHRTYSMSYSTPAPTDIGYHVFSPAEKASHVRFFLKDVSYTMPNTTFAETVKYQIDYNENQNLPCILSFAQDYLGYFNGYDNGTLLPYQNNSAWQGYANGLRSYNGAEAKKGMLEKITFPTGGYEKFNYEPNTVATWDFVSSNATLAVGGQGMSAAGTPHRRNYESAIFHVYRSQTAQLTLNISGSTIGTYGMLLGLTPGTTDYDGVHNYTIPVSLVPGDYKLTISVAAGAAGDITLVYDRSQNPDEQAHEWVNHEAGGVRVSSIESYDPVSDKTKSRYFTYAHKNSLSQSSGRTGFQTLFDEYSFYKKETTCPDILLPGNNYWVSFQCPIYTLSSNAMVPSAIYGDHIGYQNVIESDDPAFKNGGIQHTFDATSVGNIQHVRGSPIRDLPVGTQDFTRGIEMETEYFDKLLLPVKHVQYHHVEGDYCLKQYIGKAVRQKYDHYAIHGDASNLDPYDETDYIYRAFWDQLDYVTTTDFENGVQMSNRVEHSYNIDIQGNPVNIQPIQTSTTDSKGLALTTDMTYPTDYTDAVSQTMVAKNMISPVINVKQQRDGVEIKSTTTHYRDWNNNGNMIKPETVSQSLNGNTEEDRIRYYGYNVKGNPIRMSKENDVSLSYIWGYNHNFPVAEVNTDKLTTYSSFEEATEEAPWSGIHQSAVVTSPDVAMTGKNYYEENNFSLDCKPHTGIYVVSYWCDNDNGYSVSGTMSGWPKLIRSVTHGSKTWRLFEHRVNVSDIEISGSGAIDELRCYPGRFENENIHLFTICRHQLAVRRKQQHQLFRI